MELRKQERVRSDSICKVRLRRRKLIMQRLEQLAENEREHYDELEREWQIRMKVYTTVPANDSSSLDVMQNFHDLVLMP